MQNIRVERERERVVSLSLPLEEEFSLYEKLWDSLDYGEKVDKSYTTFICAHSKTIK